MAPALPSGTVTFLFTDIEGSTKLLQQLGDRYVTVLYSSTVRVYGATTQQSGARQMDSDMTSS
jgi:class 3 adenylate cyclase